MPNEWRTPGHLFTSDAIGIDSFAYDLSGYYGANAKLSASLGAGTITLQAAAGSRVYTGEQFAGGLPYRLLTGTRNTGGSSESSGSHLHSGYVRISDDGLSDEQLYDGDDPVGRWTANATTNSGNITYYSCNVLKASDDWMVALPGDDEPDFPASTECTAITTYYMGSFTQYLPSVVVPNGAWYARLVEPDLTVFACWTHNDLHYRAELTPATTAYYTGSEPSDIRLWAEQDTGDVACLLL